METPAGHAAALWPILVYFGAVIVLVAALMALSRVLGERHRDRATGEPYESGIRATGSARLRVSVKFYLVAMFFVIFDLEAVFIFAWAVAFRQVGWPGYAAMVAFIFTLIAGLLYVWRQGALDWGRSRMSSGECRVSNAGTRPPDGEGH